MRGAAIKSGWAGGLFWYARRGVVEGQSSTDGGVVCVLVGRRQNLRPGREGGLVGACRLMKVQRRLQMGRRYDSICKVKAVVGSSRRSVLGQPCSPSVAPPRLDQITDAAIGALAPISSLPGNQHSREGGRLDFI